MKIRVMTVAAMDKTPAKLTNLHVTEPKPPENQVCPR